MWLRRCQEKEEKEEGDKMYFKREGRRGEYVKRGGKEWGRKMSEKWRIRREGTDLSKKGWKEEGFNMYICKKKE